MATAIAQSALYGRVVQLQVGGLLWDQQRIRFKIKKTLRREPNEATITISNLSAESRRIVTDRGTPVVLRAGYASNIATIYSGQVFTFEDERNDTERDLTLTCRDGDSAWLGYVSQSWGAGVPRLTVVTALAAEMGLTLASGSADLIAANGSTRGPYVAHGHAFEELDDFLRPLGLSWSIQDGLLQVIAANASNGQSAVLLTPQTGLIGVPKRMEKYHKPGSKNHGVPTQVEFQSLLQPSLVPGRQVRLESDAITGNYIVQVAEFSGDTHGDDWAVTCQGAEVANV